MTAPIDAARIEHGLSRLAERASGDTIVARLARDNAELHLVHGPSANGEHSRLVATGRTLFDALAQLGIL